MSFLQPFMLAALPIIALPIIIHLINQRRFQTIQWAAMMFLLAANRMSRGYAKLRQWLILLFRTLAVAGLILAVSRPLASGWLGLAAGGKADTTIILIDRSPSMQQHGQASGVSKLVTGRKQLAQSLGMLSSSHWVLIDGATNQPQEIESPAHLEELPETAPLSASADLPAMLLAANEYVRANRPSRTEIWICSDIRQNDWNADSGRWQLIRDSFLELPQAVRFHLLAYPDAAPQNRSIRVTGVRRHETSSGAELLLSLKIEQPATLDAPASIPIDLDLDGARSQIQVEMTGNVLELKDHPIPIEREIARGWGRVTIPADANPSDNEFYFVFDQPTPRKTLLIADDPAAVRPLQLAASISSDPQAKTETEVLAPEQLVGVDWSQVALLIWQSPLPTDAQAKEIQPFLDRGGQALFFPPAAPTSDSFAGVKWTEWTEPEQPVPVATWTGDQDLLQHSQSGAALPVGGLQVSRYCGLEGDRVAIAALQGGAPLAVRSQSHRGVYFLTTTTAVGDSSLATDGVVLYVVVQRALATGAASLGNTRQLIAGDVPATSAAEWQRLAGDSDAVSTSYVWQAGVYRDGEKLLAINRSEIEDRAIPLTDPRVASLFERLDFDRVDDRAGSQSSLIEEIWRLFLAFMMAALVVEAALCLPKLNPQAQAPAQPARAAA
jgi:hypothetical protein